MQFLDKPTSVSNGAPTRIAMTSANGRLIVTGPSVRLPIMEDLKGVIQNFVSLFNNAPRSAATGKFVAQNLRTVGEVASRKVRPAVLNSEKELRYAINLEGIENFRGRDFAKNPYFGRITNFDLTKYITTTFENAVTQLNLEGFKNGKIAITLVRTEKGYDLFTDGFESPELIAMLSYNRDFFAPLLSVTPKMGEAIQISANVAQSKLVGQTHVSSVVVDRSAMLANSENGFSFISRIPGYIRGLFSDQKSSDGRDEKSEKKNEVKTTSQKYYELKRIEDIPFAEPQKFLTVSDGANVQLYKILAPGPKILFKISVSRLDSEANKIVDIIDGEGVQVRIHLTEKPTGVSSLLKDKNRTLGYVNIVEIRNALLYKKSDRSDGERTISLRNSNEKLLKELNDQLRRENEKTEPAQNDKSTDNQSIIFPSVDNIDAVKSINFTSDDENKPFKLTIQGKEVLFLGYVNGPFFFARFSVGETVILRLDDKTQATAINLTIKEQLRGSVFFRQLQNQLVQNFVQGVVDIDAKILQNNKELASTFQLGRPN